MRIITLFLLFISSIYAVTPSNETCKGCHPTIYNEYNTSLHKKSTIYEDKIHKAIWDLHPGKKKGKYVCAKCHTPTDKRVLDALKNGKEALPKNDIAQHNAISCIACHSIKNIEEHKKPHNKNISVNNDKKRPVLFAANINNRDGQITYKEETSFFGMFKSTSGSPYHDIDYRNKNFYNGNICMGCHQHKTNKHGQDVCETDKEGSIDEKSNCITCHMPKINGTATTIKITKKHTFHGFAGTTNRPDMLSKYIDLDFKKLDDGFEIVIINKAKHNLLLHPLRLAKLNITIINNSKVTKLKSVAFIKALGHNGKPAMPWLATEIFKDNMLKANEKRVIKYDTILKKDDIIEAQFGFYLVNPKIVKKLNLSDDKKSTQFTVLKSKRFIVK